MTLAIKEEGDHECHQDFFNFLFKSYLKSFPDFHNAFAHSLSFILYIFSSWGDYEHGWIWQSAVAAASEIQFWTNYKET